MLRNTQFVKMRQRPIPFSLTNTRSIDNFYTRRSMKGSELNLHAHTLLDNRSVLAWHGRVVQRHVPASHAPTCEDFVDGHGSIAPPLGGGATKRETENAIRSLI